MLTISPHFVRPISDQCELLLKQLHKLIFVTQLPPNLERDANRAYVERYKRDTGYTELRAVGTP